MTTNHKDSCTAQSDGSACGDEKVNILLVDDQPARLLSYESILSSLGQRLISVRSGNEALQQILTTEIAVILLDVSMPGMDGFETAALIHNHPRYQHIPIIFVTGIHVNDLDRLKGYQLGAVDYVSIPIVAEILRSKIAVLVELHCQRKKLQELNSQLAAANERLEFDNSALQAEKTRELEVLNQHLSQANAELAKANQALLTENQERMRVESALKEADRHKDEFIAILAHELRNPLAPIRHAVDVMSRININESAFVWSRDVIGRQVNHLTRLVDDLLDISRITHGTIKLHKEAVTVQSIIDRATEALIPVIHSHHHELEIECSDPAQTLYGDSVRLVQVLGNLLNNAAKFSPHPSRIRLCVSKQDSQVEFRVIDSGIGIAPDSLPQLFTLFSQIHDINDLARHSARRNGDDGLNHGLGIGLALVKRLVELHDGEVSVTSAGLNAGSEFVFRLPIHSATQPPVNEPASQTDDATPHRVLLVDDNADALEGLSMLMQLAGHEVFTASDGAQALKLAELHRPDVGIFDLGMPIMDGYQLAQQLRDAPAGKEMRLIALSGWGQNEDMQRAYDAGFDFHLVKPATIEVISELMTNLDSLHSH